MKLSLTALGAAVYCLSLAAQQGVPPKGPQTKVREGDMAPDFTLPSTTGKDIRLSDYRGQKNVVLAFIVKAFTGG